MEKLLNSNNDLKDLAEEDLKKERGVSGFFKRNNIFNKKSREEHQRNYENAKNQVNELEQTVADLKKQIDDNEKLRAQLLKYAEEAGGSNLALDKLNTEVSRLRAENQALKMQVVKLETELKNR